MSVCGGRGRGAPAPLLVDSNGMDIGDVRPPGRSSHSPPHSLTSVLVRAGGRRRCWSRHERAHSHSIFLLRRQAGRQAGRQMKAGARGKCSGGGGGGGSSRRQHEEEAARPRRAFCRSPPAHDHRISSSHLTPPHVPSHPFIGRGSSRAWPWGEVGVTGRLWTRLCRRSCAHVATQREAGGGAPLGACPGTCGYMDENSGRK